MFEGFNNSMRVWIKLFLSLLFKKNFVLLCPIKREIKKERRTNQYPIPI